MKKATIEAIEKYKIITIIRGVDKDKLIPLVEAIYEGGIRLVELTYSATGDPTDEDIAGRIKMLADHFKGRMYIGAGTVIREEQVTLTKEAGGLYIISPDINERIIKKTVEEGLVSIPGALTPSEITNAHNLGADFVKLFPVSVFGADYVKAVKAPLSHVKLLAVGGVDHTNLEEYTKAGACGFGIGSTIISKKLIDAQDWKGVTELAKKYTAVI